MITLEQIRRLEKGVHNAVATISAVKGENALLQQKLAGYEKRITELEARLLEFKEGQSEIERGLLAALDQLDTLEDEVFEEEVGSSSDQDPGQFIAAEETAPAEAAGAPPDEPGQNEPNQSDANEQQSDDELDIF
ncbi:MAG: cell division protein ZapB [Spirochaetaceae bacterium]|nr:MAG: cell division protein ZapB [Spirochaetaceae bacterium]